MCQRRPFLNSNFWRKVNKRMEPVDQQSKISGTEYKKPPSLQTSIGKSYVPILPRPGFPVSLKSAESPPLEKTGDTSKEESKSNKQPNLAISKGMDLIASAIANMNGVVVAKCLDDKLKDAKLAEGTPQQPNRTMTFVEENDGDQQMDSKPDAKIKSTEKKFDVESGSKKGISGCRKEKLTPSISEVALCNSRVSTTCTEENICNDIPNAESLIRDSNGSNQGVSVIDNGANTKETPDTSLNGENDPIVGVKFTKTRSELNQEIVNSIGMNNNIEKYASKVPPTEEEAPKVSKSNSIINEVVSESTSHKLAELKSTNPDISKLTHDNLDVKRGQTDLDVDNNTLSIDSKIASTNANIVSDNPPSNIDTSTCKFGDEVYLSNEDDRLSKKNMSQSMNVNNSRNTMSKQNCLASTSRKVECKSLDVSRSSTSIIDSPADQQATSNLSNPTFCSDVTPTSSREHDVPMEATNVEVDNVKSQQMKDNRNNVGVSSQNFESNKQSKYECINKVLEVEKHDRRTKTSPSRKKSLETTPNGVNVHKRRRILLDDDDNFSSSSSYDSSDDDSSDDSMVVESKRSMTVKKCKRGNKSANANYEMPSSTEKPSINQKVCDSWVTSDVVDSIVRDIAPFIRKHKAQKLSANKLRYLSPSEELAFSKSIKRRLETGLREITLKDLRDVVRRVFYNKVGEIVSQDRPSIKYFTVLFRKYRLLLHIPVEKPIHFRSESLSQPTLSDEARHSKQFTQKTSQKNVNVVKNLFEKRIFKYEKAFAFHEFAHLAGMKLCDEEDWIEELIRQHSDKFVWKNGVIDSVADENIFIYALAGKNLHSLKRNEVSKDNPLLNDMQRKARNVYNCDELGIRNSSRYLRPGEEAGLVEGILECSLFFTSGFTFDDIRQFVLKGLEDREHFLGDQGPSASWIGRLIRRHPTKLRIENGLIFAAPCAFPLVYQKK